MPVDSASYPRIPLNILFDKSRIKGFETGNKVVTGLSYDSRRVKQGHIFFAVKGTRFNGHSFVKEAIKKGAHLAIIENQVSGSFPVVRVSSVMKTMSTVSNVFFDYPSRQLPVIGVTGTNGKTTTTYLIEDVFLSQKKKCGVMGTINYRIGPDSWEAPNTTPMSLDVHEFIWRSKACGAETVVMEVSSHALELNRVDDVQFSVGVFTNLTQDHLDFHKTMESYFSSKRKLFLRPEKPKAVINIDDEWGERLAGDLPDVLTYGRNPNAVLRAGEAECNLEGIQFQLYFPSGKTASIKTNLLGRHNFYNCLSAAGALLSYGLKEEEIVEGLNKKHAVPGRLERVEKGQNFVVAIDYAHTNDALAQVLKTLRDTGPRRLVCVFGAGGDRDRGKRPKMGAVAVTLCDYVYVTSDNPRTEKPADIMRDIETGIKQTGKDNYVLIEDREEAIEKAIRSSSEGDIVLIAGKGHETCQIIGNKKIHFSDFEISKKVLASWN